MRAYTPVYARIYVRTSPAHACGYSPRTPARILTHTRVHMHIRPHSAHIMRRHGAPHTRVTLVHMHTSCLLCTHPRANILMHSHTATPIHMRMTSAYITLMHTLMHMHYTYAHTHRYTCMHPLHMCVHAGAYEYVHISARTCYHAYIHARAVTYSCMHIPVTIHYLVHLRYREGICIRVRKYIDMNDTYIRKASELLNENTFT